MTTPPTPADWYPDPEDPAGLRYWDGTGWTEHRAPAPLAADEPPASEQATSVVSLPDLPPVDQPTTAVPTWSTIDPQAGGAHRAFDDEQETPGQPYDTHPPVTYEPQAPESTPWDAPLPSWDSPPPVQSYDAPPPTESFDAPPSTPSFDAPPSTPSFGAAPFAPPPGPPGPAYSQAGQPADGPNMKLVAGILGGGLAILIAIVVVAVFVVMRKDDPTVTSSQASSSTSETTSSETTTESSTESSATEAPLPPPPGAEGSDGAYTFSVASTETGDTITSTFSDAVETTADGMYYVVRLNVANTGTDPLTFVATFQQLNAGGQVFPLDDEATAFLGGTIAEIAPGERVETPLVYDVPLGTEASTILLRADPVSPGVELPLQ